MKAKKPHQITDDKIGRLGMTSVGLILLAIASKAEFEAEIVMDGLQKTNTFVR
jgi:hypothetical protein